MRAGTWQNSQNDLFARPSRGRYNYRYRMEFQVSLRVYNDGISKRLTEYLIVIT